MRRRDLEAGIRLWLAAASGVDIASIKRVPYDGVRPQGLHLAYQLQSTRRLGRDTHHMHTEADDTGELPLVTSGERELTVGVTVYGRGMLSGEEMIPEDITERISSRYQTPELGEIARSLSFAVAIVRDVAEQATFVEGLHEERAALELVVRYVATARTYPSHIEQVALEARLIDGESSENRTVSPEC